MKITDITTAYPVWGGNRNFLFVVVDTDEGIYGVGEAGSAVENWQSGRDRAFQAAARRAGSLPDEQSGSCSIGAVSSLPSGC